MKQQLMNGPRDMELREVPVPQPGPDEVRIRVARIGICGSDIYVWHGNHPFSLSLSCRGTNSAAISMRLAAMSGI